MRNCFVPNCDAYCKQHAITKRMMFSAPKENFDSWKKVLHSKREFRETDRVCERHFDKSQILTHWNHLINGQVYQLEREKPKIEPSAIPCLNLSEYSAAAVETNTRRKPRRTNNKKRKSQNVAKNDDLHTDMIEMEVLEDTEIDKIIDESTALVDEKRHRFIEMYNEIANIELPCSLWGVHTDPENYRFIAFSKFDDRLMKCIKVLRITDEHMMDIRMDDISKSTAELNELNIDIIVDALRSLDEISNE